MKDFLLKHWIKITGVAVGTLGGYIYYYFIGCVSGTCPITSNPYNMMIYGAVLGYLLFELFSDVVKDRKTEKVSEISEINDSIDKNKL
jgi:hypothetical protein